MADPAVTSATPHGAELPDNAGLLAGAANHGWVGDEGRDASLEGIPMTDRSVVLSGHVTRKMSMRGDPPPQRDLTLEMWKVRPAPFFCVSFWEIACQLLWFRLAPFGCAGVAYA